MDRLKTVIGSAFGSGYLPEAPGTWGSLTALVPIYICIRLGGSIALGAFIISTCLLTLWTADTCTSRWGPDPGRLVMDEWAGEGLVFIPFVSAGRFPTDLLLLVFGFLLFRFFDIRKPLGVSYFDRIQSKWGILLDDLLAGFYANLCLKIFILLALKPITFF